MHPLVVAPAVDPDITREIQTRRPDLPVEQPADPSTVPDACADPDEPIGFLCANSMWRAEYLCGLSVGDWVVTMTTGYENYPVEVFRDRGVVFSNSPGITVEPIAEHVFALLFTVSRRLRTYHDQQDERLWKRQPEGMTDFEGDPCTVVGIGRIGEAVAVRARAFGMSVRGVKRSVAGYDGAADEVYPAGELNAALEGARVVVLSVPLTEETRGLIGAEELSACRDDAIVINVCRGPVLDTDALVAALDRGEIRAACVDVVDERPPPPEWPLWDRDDVVITPHVAGKSDKTPERLVDLLLAEYDRWRTGEPPVHAIVTADDS